MKYKNKRIAMRKVLLCIYFGVSVLMINAQETKHTVKAGESLYAIARIYSISVKDIVAANSSLNGGSDIRPGQVLIIPGKGSNTTTTAAPPRATAVSTPAATPKATTNATPSQPVKVRTHTVAKGETFYAICKKYGVSSTDVKKWNNLSDLNVRIGQKLIVAKENKQASYTPVAVASTPDTQYQQEDVRPRNEAIIPNDKPSSLAVEQEQIAAAERAKEAAELAASKPAPVSEGLRTSSSNPGEYRGIFNSYPINGYKIKKNRGAATYLNDNTTGNQYLAFYNGAETGSIIRVTNMMNLKTIYVKVMGKVPPADAAQEVVLKLTSKAADELGVIDEKFLVEVAAYGTK